MVGINETLTNEMNSSLSTCDSLFNSIPNPSSSSQPNPQVSDKTRSSPSFNNDSEPPTYFEAVGIPQNSLILNIDDLNHDSTNTSRFSSFQQRLPKISMNTSPEAYNKDFSSNQPSQNYVPNHQRHPVLTRSYNLPLSVTQQNRNMCTNNESNSLDSISKPSETYLVWSIFTTIYCVFIGVPALVLSIKVYHYNKQEDYQKAYSRSKITRYLNIAGLLFGIVYMTIGVIACLVPTR